MMGAVFQRCAAVSLGIDLRRICILVMMCCALFFSGCSSKKTIINGLDEREANEIIVFLSSKGIDAYKVQAKSDSPGGAGQAAASFDISVDSEKATDAMSILSANGLPRRRPQKLLDLFNAGGLVPSELQEKIRFQSGLAEQIAGVIRKIDGILDADVQLSFPEEDPLNPQNKKGAVTASVFIKHQGVLDDPNSQLVTKIRRLVASSVQGLSFDNVTVIADKGRFSDVSTRSKAKGGENGGPDMTRIWTVVVANESVGRFQAIFVTLAAALLITTSVAVWLGWKIIPVARSMGGVAAIFSMTPLVEAKGQEEIVPEEPSPDEEKKESKGAVEAGGKKAQENIESP